MGSFLVLSVKWYVMLVFPFSQKGFDISLGHIDPLSHIHESFVTSRVSGRDYKNGLVRLSVCLSVCLFVSALTADSFDVRSWNLVQALTLMIPYNYKLDCQGHRSKLKVTGSKNMISKFFLFEWAYAKPYPMVWHHDVMWRHGLTSSYDVTKWRHSQRAAGGAATL